MGYHAGGQCWPDLQSARLAWCQSLDTGSYAMSCDLDASGSIRISMLQSDGTAVTVTHEPLLTPCDPTPPQWEQALPVIAAVVALWASVWAFKKISSLFEPEVK